MFRSRQDRDHWRDQAQRLALAAPKPVEPQVGDHAA
jgi:predicted flap endonuclease-1-like 5' DNA nuclease